MHTNTQSLLVGIWRELEAATRTRTPFTLAQLATVGTNGAPRLRAVILREFDAATGCVYFSTRVATEKLEEIRREPRVALTVTSEHPVSQLRMEGVAEIVEDAEERQAAWEHFDVRSRAVLYSSPLTPAVPLDQISPAERTEFVHGPASEESQFARFVWVRVRLERLDWVDLSVPGHERARFARDGDTWSGERVTP